MNKQTEWTLAPLDTRLTITTSDGVYIPTPNKKEPFARVGKIDFNNIIVVEFRSEEAIEQASKITAYSLVEDAE